MLLSADSVGHHLRRFSVTRSSDALSALLSMSATPALMRRRCSRRMRPVTAMPQGSVRLFKRALYSTRDRLFAGRTGSLKLGGSAELISAALLFGLTFAFIRMPAGFLPVDDQGVSTTDVHNRRRMRPMARTEAADREVANILAQRRRDNVTFLTGSLLRPGPSTPRKPGLHLVEVLVGPARVGFGHPRSWRTSTASWPRSATPRIGVGSRRRSTILRRLFGFIFDSCRTARRKATPRR